MSVSRALLHRCDRQRRVLWANAGVGKQGRLGEITEEDFDDAFSLNARTLFTVQKALPLVNDGGSIFMTGSNASLRGYPNLP